jgi:hypothetical protein
MKRTKVNYEFALYPETVIDPNGFGLYGDAEFVDCGKGELQKHLDRYDVNNVGDFKYYGVYVKKWHCTYEEPYHPYDEWQWDEIELSYDHDKKVWIDHDEILPKYVMSEINKAKFPEGSLQKYPSGYELEEYSDLHNFDEESKCWVYG